MMGKTIRFRLYRYNDETWRAKNNILSSLRPVT